MTEARAAEGTPGFMVTEAMFDERDWSRGQTPTYRVSEVASFFFAMSESWLRRLLRATEDHPNTWFTHPDGTRMDFRRKDPAKSDSERVFTLADVEPMAWSLRRAGAIDALRLGQILRVVEAEAYLWGFLAPREDGAE